MTRPVGPSSISEPIRILLLPSRYSRPDLPMTRTEKPSSLTMRANHFRNIGPRPRGSSRGPPSAAWIDRESWFHGFRDVPPGTSLATPLRHDSRSTDPQREDLPRHAPLLGASLLPQALEEDRGDLPLRHRPLREALRRPDPRLLRPLEPLPPGPPRHPWPAPRLRAGRRCPHRQGHQLRPRPMGRLLGARQLQRRRARDARFHPREARLHPRQPRGRRPRPAGLEVARRLVRPAANRGAARPDRAAKGVLRRGGADASFRRAPAHPS